MKILIKTSLSIFAFFFVANFSFAQTTNGNDSGTSADIVNTDNSNPYNLNLSADSTSASTGSNTAVSYSLDANGNVVTNANPTPVSTYQPEKVRGTRAPNEYPSGRSGGQYVNPNTINYKIKSPSEMGGNEGGK